MLVHRLRTDLGETSTTTPFCLCFRNDSNFSRNRSQRFASNGARRYFPTENDRDTISHSGFSQPFAIVRSTAGVSRDRIRWNTFSWPRQHTNERTNERTKEWEKKNGEFFLLFLLSTTSVSKNKGHLVPLTAKRNPWHLHIDDAWKPPLERKRDLPPPFLGTRQPYTTQPRRIFCLFLKFNRIATTFTCHDVRASRYAKSRWERREISLLSLSLSHPSGARFTVTHPLESRFSRKVRGKLPEETERIDKAHGFQIEKLSSPVSAAVKFSAFRYPATGIRGAVSASTSNFPPREFVKRAQPPCLFLWLHASLCLRIAMRERIADENQTKINRCWSRRRLEGKKRDVRNT